MLSCPPAILVSLLGVLVGTGAVRGSDEPKKASTVGVNISEIRSAVHDLSHQLDDLLEGMVDTLSGKVEKTWYRKVESVLNRLEPFEQALKPDMGRDVLYREWDQMDAELQPVLKGLESLKPKDHSWQRRLFKVRSANEELLYAIALGDPAEKRVRQVAEHQAQILTLLCEQLELTARYVLADTPGTDVLLGHLQKLHMASDSLSKEFGSADSLKNLSDDAAALTRAWKEVVLDFQRLAPRDSIYLLHTAGRVDRIHQRIFHLMGMKGKCPTLTIRS